MLADQTWEDLALSVVSVTVLSLHIVAKRIFICLPSLREGAVDYSHRQGAMKQGNFAVDSARTEIGIRRRLSQSCCGVSTPAA